MFRMTRMTDRIPEAIWIGTAILISFFTPASEVKVEAPVKFIARKDDIPERRKNIRGRINTECSNVPLNTSIDDTTVPVRNPLNEKLLSGR